MKQLCVLNLLLTSLVGLHAQSSFSWDVGAEFQAYPTGLIPGLVFEFGFAERNGVHLKLGYNIFDHRDLGEHDDEDGSGLGISMGYRRYFQDGQGGFLLGARSDVWFNGVDWIDNPGEPLQTVGHTDLIVVQPTVEAGYQWKLANNQLRLAPHAAFGWEWNARTEGSDTGQGAIVLVGVRLQYRVKEVRPD